MTTWAQLLGEVQTELKDLEGKKFPKETIYIYLKDAISDYSQFFPLRVIREQLVYDADVEAFTLPENILTDIQVESPRDRFIERRIVRPGVRFSMTATPTLYWIEGGYLFLNSKSIDEAEVLLTYDALHGLPANADDDDYNLTVPSRDDELIRLYLRAKVSGQVRQHQATLDRFRVGGGKRTDNPMEPETGNLWDEYDMKVATRTPAGTVYLWRPGRKL